MVDIAKHIRIFNPDPTDDLVRKRTTAIDALCLKLSRTSSVKVVFQWANDLSRAVEARGEISNFLIDRIENTIRESAEAFVAEGQELQMTVCGLLAALKLLDSGNNKNMKLMATAIYSALSIQNERSEAKLEALRAELLNKSRETFQQTAIKFRERVDVPQIPNKNDISTFRRSTINAVDALRTNAMLDQEEINLLWWFLSDWSNIFSCRFSNIENPETKSLALGIEASQLLQGFPADAHKNLLLKFVDNSKAMSLPDLIRSIGDECEPLAQVHQDNQFVEMFPAIFPLLNALQPKHTVGSSNEPERPMAEWASRALLESTIGKVKVK